MTTLAVAYFIAWSALAGYALTLGAANRRIAARLSELERTAEEREPASSAHEKSRAGRAQAA